VTDLGVKCLDREDSNKQRNFSATACHPKRQWALSAHRTPTSSGGAAGKRNPINKKKKSAMTDFNGRMRHKTEAAIHGLRKCVNRGTPLLQVRGRTVTAVLTISRFADNQLSC
jgi:hypothetical protein